MNSKPSLVSQESRYAQGEGQAVFTGIHAIVRAFLDQRARDCQLGLNTRLFCSGYQGSPLGTLDKELFGLTKRLEDEGIVFHPGLNEELALTSVMGSQLAPSFPGATADGVVGVWYGKAPGLDRAGDAIRHANLVGTHPKGGAVLLVGDDPASKSSTVPSASERTLAALSVPVLYPQSPSDILPMFAHAVAMSRYSGTMVALKIITDVADAYESLHYGSDVFLPNLGPGVHQPSSQLLPPKNLVFEKDLLEVRVPKALEYARAAGLNPVTMSNHGAKLGIIAGGKTYVDLLQAFEVLGLDISRLPLALMRVDLLWPHDPRGFRSFAQELDTILVLEEKGPFLQTAVMQALYTQTHHPVVCGTSTGAAPASGQLTVDVITRALLERLDGIGVKINADILKDMNQATVPPQSPMARTPFFCSGCPHNSSTIADDETLIGAGIGCHTMVLLAPSAHGNITGITQMGGEGAQWTGISPFTDDNHFTQNVGDGTFHHSASLAVRASVAAGTNITYKLLFNSAVAMTGGQDIPGGMGLEALTRSLQAEGVKEIVVCLSGASKYKRRALAKNVTFKKKNDLDSQAKRLSEVPGTTVLIYDGECAAERRRKRKRGTASQPTKRVLINARVCEGCGDCGKKSSCLSVVPKDTAYGRKTEIAQSSCNTDFSCLQGDCPSFITVKTSQAKKKKVQPAPTASDPKPAKRQVQVRVVGVGGTGIVTTSQIIAQAAVYDSLPVRGLDQTGLAQKGGTVTSDVAIGLKTGSGKIPPAGADLFLVLDLVAGASTQPLTACGKQTMVIASSTLSPTIETVTDVRKQMPESESFVDVIASRCKDVDAKPFHEWAEQLLGNPVYASMMMVGYAVQEGLLNVTSDSMLAAIDLNKADAENNKQAFLWGRALADKSTNHIDEEDAKELPPAPDWAAQICQEHHLPKQAGQLAGELARWGSKKDGQNYLQCLSTIDEQVKFAGRKKEDLLTALAFGLFKLTAYKDEYEIARLHLDAAQIAKRQELFGKAKVTYHLQPPILKALGMKGKIGFGQWFTYVFMMLAKMKMLRGGLFDVFGYTKVRRIEKKLATEYLQWVTTAVSHLTATNYQQVMEVIQSADGIRGYEDIKLDNLTMARGSVARTLSDLEQGKSMMLLPMV